VVGLGVLIAALMLIAPPQAAAQNGWSVQTTPATGVKAAPAGQAKKAAKERVISINIAKGETYTIDGVAENGEPGIKIVSNPNALTVRTDAPGRIVLLGTDTGTWRLNVALASGEKVIYQVNVTATAPPLGSLQPGAAPTVMP
jgi:ABC-type uncharacterized transport system ATPase subunit